MSTGGGGLTCPNRTQKVRGHGNAHVERFRQFPL